MRAGGPIAPPCRHRVCPEARLGALRQQARARHWGEDLRAADLIIPGLPASKHDGSWSFYINFDQYLFFHILRRDGSLSLPKKRGD